MALSDDQLGQIQGGLSEFETLSSMPGNSGLDAFSSMPASGGSIAPSFGSFDGGDAASNFDSFDGGAFADAGFADAGFADGGFADAGFADAGFADAGFADAGFADAGFADAGFADAGFADAGFADAGFADAGFADAGFADAGFADAGFADAGSFAASDNLAEGDSFVGGGFADGLDDSDGFVDSGIYPGNEVGAFDASAIADLSAETSGDDAIGGEPADGGEAPAFAEAADAAEAPPELQAPLSQSATAAESSKAAQVGDSSASTIPAANSDTAARAAGEAPVVVGADAGTETAKPTVTDSVETARAGKPAVTFLLEYNDNPAPSDPSAYSIAGQVSQMVHEFDKVNIRSVTLKNSSPGEVEVVVAAELAENPEDYATPPLVVIRGDGNVENGVHMLRAIGPEHVNTLEVLRGVDRGLGGSRPFAAAVLSLESGNVPQQIADDPALRGEVVAVVADGLREDSSSNFGMAADVLRDPTVDGTFTLLDQANVRGERITASGAPQDIVLNEYDADGQNLARATALRNGDKNVGPMSFEPPAALKEFPPTHTATLDPRALAFADELESQLGALQNGTAKSNYADKHDIQGLEQAIETLRTMETTSLKETSGGNSEGTWKEVEVELERSNTSTWNAGPTHVRMFSGSNGEGRLMASARGRFGDGADVIIEPPDVVANTTVTTSTGSSETYSVFKADSKGFVGEKYGVMDRDGNFVTGWAESDTDGNPSMPGFVSNQLQQRSGKK